ncbi:MAG TPA: YciI family protein [Devosia sp.]|nr:YciI family protein [Devosia sp.]
MKFLCLVYFEPDAFAGLSPEEMKRIDDATIEHDHKLRDAGHLLIASPLDTAEEAVNIDRRQRMKMSVVDGPYAEAKEVIGGFLLLEARDMTEAVTLFDDDPIAAYSRLVIRPLMEAHRHSETGQARPDFRPA